jgi:hypothetical protein
MSHPVPGPAELVLHPSHHWGQRPIFERTAPGSNLAKWQMIPCCLNCLVDGYEDVPDAFQPCRRAAKP